jgi:hypothetical protein
MTMKPAAAVPRAAAAACWLMLRGDWPIMRLGSRGPKFAEPSVTQQDGGKAPPHVRNMPMHAKTIAGRFVADSAWRHFLHPGDTWS